MLERRKQIGDEEVIAAVAADAVPHEQCARCRVLC